MTSTFQGPNEDGAVVPASESPTNPRVRKARVTASAVTIRELPAAVDTAELPATRGPGFRAPEEGGSDRPFDAVRPARGANPLAPTLPARAQRTTPQSKSSPMEKPSSPSNRRKR